MNALKFSIITPTLNQGHFIEDTIRSVMGQNYSNYEHIIIDGGSTDNTLDILKKYPHLKWISEKDSGQSNAINKGFKMATGDILAWINSDDYYEAGVFRKVAEGFAASPGCMMLYGNIAYIDKNKNELYRLTGDVISFKSLIESPDIVRQPSSFWRKEVLGAVGYLDESLHLVMDFDFFLRITKKFQVCFIDENISYYRCYQETKTLSMLKKQTAEIYKVIGRHAAFIPPKTYKYLLGKYLDSMDEGNLLRKMLQPLRKSQ